MDFFPLAAFEVADANVTKGGCSHVKTRVRGINLAGGGDFRGSAHSSTGTHWGKSYVYDETASGVIEGFLYQGQLRPVAWLDGTGAVKARFVYGTRVNVPEYMVTSTATYRIVTDHLGSPRLVVDTSSGAVAQRVDYDEWGIVLSDSNPGFQPFGFAGGLWDRDTGLVRSGARDYDAIVGRWVNKDPINVNGRDPNLYAYVWNDPINWIDPSGLDSIVFSRNWGSVTWFNDNGDILGIYSGISGPFGKGALPDGYYLGSNLRKNRTDKGMVCGRGTKDQIGFSLDLDPQFSTDRTDLRFHPDERPIGTQGCIGISCWDARDFYDALNDYFNTRGNKTIPVTVGP